MLEAGNTEGRIQHAGELLLFVPPSSLKELEQVHCKFYNELGRILVKDFVPVQLAEELSGELEEDFSTFAPQDVGKCPPPLKIFTHQAASFSYFPAQSSSLCVSLQSLSVLLKTGRKCPGLIKRQSSFWRFGETRR